MLELEESVRRTVLSALELPMEPEELPFDAPLFGPKTVNGLGLDSLAALEILAALSRQYDLPLDDVEVADFRSVQSLADYLKRHGVTEPR